MVGGGGGGGGGAASQSSALEFGVVGSIRSHCYLQDALAKHSDLI